MVHGPWSWQAHTLREGTLQGRSQSKAEQPHASYRSREDTIVQFESEASAPCRPWSANFDGVEDHAGPQRIKSALSTLSSPRALSPKSACSHPVWRHCKGPAAPAFEDAWMMAPAVGNVPPCNFDFSETLDQVRANNMGQDMIHTSHGVRAIVRKLR